MRYASRSDGAERPAPLHVNIDAMLAEAREIEREKVLLEVRREIGAIPIHRAKDRTRTWDTTPRSPEQVRQDALAIVDRKLSQ